MDRIYITGVKGMLGRAVVPLFRERYEIFPADLGETDVRDADAIMGDICRTKPRFVLHLAAITDVDACEKNPDEAYGVNALGTRNVALACQRSDAVMAYISTGMVYDGRKETPYVEFDPACPLNVYARSKYQGEIMMKDLLSRFYTFYSCWLFGGGIADKKFVGRIIERARNTSELRVVNDKFGSPTYTVDLAKRMFDFIESGLYGKYHCANAGCVNRFEMSLEILKAAGITGCRLVPVSSDEFALPAARPRMEALRNYNFELLGLAPMRNWADALNDYIETMNA
ncbi:MAG: dTDP-4-dehydrorhamnose reductase [Candidatus Krumholzibacteria bacterium]|nr:dTDP-4-dehydrorhamnose reductase [Candidatus Krumholzibacteria bacterium]